MIPLPTLSELGVLAQVVLIDLALAGDNAVVIGLAVTSLPAERRRRAILTALAAAALLRLALALIAERLLAIIGFTLAGGLLLLWVCWKSWRELKAGQHSAKLRGSAHVVLRLMLADLSMSLDNVLALAGATRRHPWVLAAGLGLSVLLMATAAEIVARLLERYRWLAWLGLLIVLQVALSMIARGLTELGPFSL